VKKEGLGKVLGEETFEATGSPELATGAQLLPDLALAITGLRSLKATQGVAKEAGAKSSALFSHESPTKAAIRKTIQKNPTDNKTAKFIIDGAGKVKSDKVAIEAIKQGFDEGVVAAVKGSSKADKVIMNKMIGIVEKGQRNKTFALKNRPEDVIGESILKRWKVVRDANKQAGSRLNRVARTLQGNRVDVDSSINAFIDDLAELGVTVDDTLKASFDPLSVGDIGAAKSFINQTLKDLKTAGNDAFKVHRLKKLIDEKVSFGKVGEGITGKTEAAVKTLRRNLDQSLDSKFPKYNEVNTKFAETITALDDFKDAAGAKNFNPFSPNADKFVGKLSRRLLSNVQSRERLMDALSNLEKVATKNGGRFQDDIFTQAMFADDLERIFGAFAPKSLQGVTEKAVVQGGQAITGGAFDTALRLGAKAAEKARGINAENAIKSVRQLVKESANKAK